MRTPFWASVFGGVGGCVFPLGLMWQIKKMWSTGETEALSYGREIIFMSASTCVGIYGFMNDMDYIIFVSSGASVILEGVILCYKVKLEKCGNISDDSSDNSGIESEGYYTTMED